MASRTCWHCGTKAHHTITADPVKSTVFDLRSGAARWMTPFSCDECKVLSIGSLYVMEAGYHIVTNDVRSMVDNPNDEIEWLPAKPLGRRYPDVPAPISDAASEAHACHSIRSYRAAVLMARSVIEATAKDQGIDKGTLREKIDAMRDQDLIRPVISEAAHEIRHLGNDMAHGDFIQPIDEAESAEILELMGVVLTEVYQMPSQLQARKEARVARTTPQVP